MVCCYITNTFRAQREGCLKMREYYVSRHHHHHFEWELLAFICVGVCLRGRMFSWVVRGLLWRWRRRWSLGLGNGFSFQCCGRSRWVKFRIANRAHTHIFTIATRTTSPLRLPALVLIVVHTPSSHLPPRTTLASAVWWFCAHNLFSCRYQLRVCRPLKIDYSSGT